MQRCVHLRGEFAQRSALPLQLHRLCAAVLTEASVIEHAFNDAAQSLRVAFAGVEVGDWVDPTGETRDVAGVGVPQITAIDNVATALQVEGEVRAHGAVPATMAVMTDPAGMPAPVMDEPTATLVTAETVSEVDAELATVLVVVAVPR